MSTMGCLQGNIASAKRRPKHFWIGLKWQDQRESLDIQRLDSGIPYRLKAAAFIKHLERAEL